MVKKDSFLSLFKEPKPIIGMIHLKGKTVEEKVVRAVGEICLMIDMGGMSAVIIENFFRGPYVSGYDLTTIAIEEILAYLAKQNNRYIYGVNILGDHKYAFELANKYNAHFIQMDSVSGHLWSEADWDFEKELSALRADSNAYLLGGVRFKYQPVLSGRSEEQDLKIGMTRCDAIVVTGEGTAIKTPNKKIKEFRNVIEDFPLIVGAGLTPSNCRKQLVIADGGIIGSYIKEGYNVEGDASLDNINEFMAPVKRLRKSL